MPEEKKNSGGKTTTEKQEVEKWTFNSIPWY